MFFVFVFVLFLLVPQHDKLEKLVFGLFCKDNVGNVYCYATNKYTT